MVVWNRAPAHQRGDHRHAGDFRELHEQLGGVCIDDAAARNDHRAVGVVEHRQRLLDLLHRRLRFIHGQRLVGVRIELDFGHLYVERQVDQDRTRAARAHQVKRLLKRARYLRRFHDRGRPFADRLGDRLDVHRLEIFLVHARARRLARDAQNRNRIRGCRVQPGDHIGAGRARGADAHADVAGRGAGVALGHV